jgi:hypothetical protein
MILKFDDDFLYGAPFFLMRTAFGKRSVSHAPPTFALRDASPTRPVQFLGGARRRSQLTPRFLEIIMSSFHGTSFVKRFLAAALCGASIGAMAHSNWAAVASVGTPDETSQSRVDFNAQSAGIKPEFVGPSFPVTLRYYVADTFGGPVGIPALVARFSDNGTGSGVTVALRGYHKTNGTSYAVTSTLDSDAFPASTGFQTQSITNCSGFMDFNSYVYYIEATLTRLNSTGAPRLGWVGVEPSLCAHAADASPN